MVSPVSVSGWPTVAILGGFLAVLALHYAKRREGTARIVEAGHEPSATKVIAFTPFQRTMHWSIAIILATLATTGYEIFLLPNVSKHPFTLTSLLLHEDISIFLLTAIVLHAIVDSLRMKGFSHIAMHPSSDLRLLVASFRATLGLGEDAFREGKYDVLMRGYHWSLLAALVVLGITGIYFWDPYNLIPANHLPVWLFGAFLQLHVYTSAVLVGLIAGHIYFSVLPVNRPLLGSMVNGQLSPEYYDAHYNPQLWAPNVVSVPTPILLKLTSRLSPSAFYKSTGIRDRAVLEHTKRAAVPFSVIQRTCGYWYVKDRMARCRDKHGEPCLANKCPVLGSYVPDYVRQSRRRFIRNASIAALSVGLLAAGIGSAGLQQRPRSTGGGSAPPPAGQVVLANSNSMQPNTSKYFTDAQGNPAILIRLASGQFEAYSAVCTHQGCTVEYVPSYKEIGCPCHGAIFDPTTGGVIQGPAFYPLPRIQITFDQASGNVYLG